MKALSKTFVDALTVKQARKRLTFLKLAKITGVNNSTLSGIVNRRIDAVQERTFDKLNDWLLEEETK
ncbi:hypothetical protein [Fructobacillus fructosus]|uniref:HTH cro/C1-type domain-containing protein n=1 Tax=Fructobacillus fructosus TaxID=1631 RepID=A0ABM9MQQ5_9LACO|nr:hypothetical protein [Fructobacillus fructosus]MBC9119411.1 hypothetical protein [Fructobacillus fructosus]MBD9366934.1 hypothetical protein [Leuconostoc mesenteroides]CAK1233329.1 unnamed protein product [Fructobacillus fructosus]CAK1252214.1 unnamed protein product [Fructobacillus fructosus]